MLRRLKITLLCASFLSACSASGQLDDTYVGTTSVHFKPAAAIGNSFGQGPYFQASNCIENGAHFDIRLDTLLVNQAFEGRLENASERLGGSLWNGDTDETNELGVFVSIEENDRRAGKVIKHMDNRLIYASFSRKAHQPINVLNRLVFTGVNHGNDLRFAFQVREFDAQKGKHAIGLLKTISQKASGFVSNTVGDGVADLLDDIGENAQSFFKDEIIMAFDTELVPCQAYSAPDTGHEQLYLSQGQLLFIRHAQSGRHAETLSAMGQVDWNDALNMPQNKTTNAYLDKTFTSFRIYQRQAPAAANAN